MGMQYINSTDAGEPEDLKEAMTTPNRHLCEMSAIPEINNFLSRKEWITIKVSKVNPKRKSQYL